MYLQLSKQCFFIIDFNFFSRAEGKFYNSTNDKYIIVRILQNFLILIFLIMFTLSIMSQIRSCADGILREMHRAISPQWSFGYRGFCPLNNFDQFVWKALWESNLSCAHESSAQAYDQAQNAGVTALVHCHTENTLSILTYR